MKKTLYITIILTSSIWSSCDFDDVLTEIPKDFQSPENSFSNIRDFESSLANIYLTIRTDMYANSDSWQNFDMLGVDIDYAASRVDNDTYNEYFYWNTLNADNGFVSKWWERLYDWVYQANVIIARAEGEEVQWDTEEDKNKIIAEARFLRAFAYHFLANLWGGVPLILEETSGPKFDYQRASQTQVYEQCKTDLEYAVQWMKTVDEIKGGMAPRAAAYHLLSEVLISLGDYNGAVEAASMVIDDPNFKLMTERFGRFADFSFNGYDYQGSYDSWGDVYWDLFREGNFNWQDGNSEAIWNVQFDQAMLGGGNVGQWGGNFGLERWWAPGWWGIKDIDGVSNWLKDTLSGRPVGALSATEYASQTLWEFKDDWDNDIRNSEYNIQRTYYWTNPESAFYGQPVTLENIGDPSSFYSRTAPYFKKAAGCLHYNQFQDSQSGQGHDNGRIYKDWYLMRLAETYLLRGEAHLLNGNITAAAEDINVIRNRAQASLVAPDEVNIDLILDERARELYMEEFRMSTLTRLNKLSEYLMKYNPAVIQNGYVLDEHLNKLPIPRSEIEANKEVMMEQNPGY
ncbi:hypothetical protein OKW21_004673 [Catalinimonas alkaloidigena]|uniref:RagB/SusD family nutrient uptake outer membrane protein n=1 Tax=Catalinimonas alkaloidigena TaxID=1075417 RepID=UPI002405C086|nr:RagB/SusD family nutrient uptake outer membrane protein [Catalinimonas alkaloidigena]MDF9799410.1 hypothetical protein [Catalinimonas alkaloidigena]